jgi:hypothetical protein
VAPRQLRSSLPRRTQQLFKQLSSRIRTAIAFAAIVVCLPAPDYASSPYPWATYYATKRTQPITIDGDLSDWASVPGFTMAQEKFFFVGQGMSSAKWGGPKDLSATFRVQWDEKYLYLAIQVTDDKVTEPHGSLVAGTETGSWDDDGVEVMLDEDGCCATRYYIGDLIHHEFHFVYSARHPFVFDNFWKAEPGAPQAMFNCPMARKSRLHFPGKSWRRMTSPASSLNPLTTESSHSSERTLVTTSRFAWRFRGPRWPPSTREAIPLALTSLSTTTIWVRDRSSNSFIGPV